MGVSNTASGIKAGTVAYFAAASAPSGWLKANGAAISRTAYAALFAAIGTTYGAGDGSTTFNLPDLRGEFLRSYDDGRGVDSGRVMGSAQLDAYQKHRHYTSASTQYSNQGAMQPTGVSNSYNTPTWGHIEDGGGTPRTDSETRPRNIALLACIKY